MVSRDSLEPRLWLGRGQGQMKSIDLGSLKFLETPLQHWHISCSIQLFLRRNRLSIRGKPQNCDMGKYFKNIFRYIDQYQGSLNLPSATVERGDWDVYQTSVMVAAGTLVVEDDLSWVYTEYTQIGSHDTSLLYNNWLNGSM